MSITGIGAGISPVASFSFTPSSSTKNSTPAAGSTSQPDSFQSDFAALLSAVQSGNITTAQSALTSIQSDLQGATAGYSPSSTSSNSPTSAVAGATSSSPMSDLDALFAAVKSGDMTGAQAALAQFKTDAQSSTQQATGHHHHHHHHGGGGSEASTSTPSTTGTAGSTADATDPFALTPPAV